MRHLIPCISIILVAACADDPADDANAGQSDTGMTTSSDAGTDASDAEQGSNSNNSTVECEPSEVTFDDGCSSQGLTFNVPIRQDTVSIVTSRSYPSVTGAQPGDLSRQDITEQCYVEERVGGDPGTPTDLPCFDAGTLTLTAAGTSVEIPWNSETCYEEAVGEAWADETVAFDFTGGDDIDAVSFDVELPDEVLVEVTEDAGGVTLTRTNPDSSGDWLLWWVFSDAADVYCEPVDDVVTLSAADIAAIDARGDYQDPFAIQTGLDGAYVGGGNGVLVNIGSYVQVSSTAW